MNWKGALRLIEEMDSKMKEAGSDPQEWTPEVIAAEKAICDALWKAKGVRGDAIWPTEELRSIINSALDAERERGYQAMLDEREKVTALKDKLAAERQKVLRPRRNLP
jgi:hypothetical protein